MTDPSAPLTLPRPLAVELHDLLGRLLATPEPDREQRIPLDDLTSGDLDSLYDDLDRYAEVVGELNDTLVHRAKQVAYRDAAIARVRALHTPVQHLGRAWCRKCSVRRSTGPKAEEWVAFIPHPCPTLEALEDTSARR